MRFDVYKMPPGGQPGYLVDVQADHLAGLPTRIVIPVIENPRQPPPMNELNPRVTILGDDFTLLTQELASVQKRLLGRPITSLAEHRDEITRALDLLFTGF